MAQLQPVSQSRPLGAHSVRLDLLNGNTVTASDCDRSFEAAKAIHRNIVRVPRWVIAAGLTKPPGWLANHTAQPTAAGLLQPEGGIRWCGDEQQTGLSYHADQGIIINRERVPRAPMRSSMNLSTDAWIPIVWTEGKSEIVSLREARAGSSDSRPCRPPS